MDLTDRTDLIIAALRKTGRVSVSDLSHQTGVSEMTVRRDLAALERRGLLRRVHGGASVAVSRGFEPSFQNRVSVRAEQKQRVGARAAQLVEPGSTVIVDAGTTTLEAARQLPDTGLTVCPLGLQAVAALADRPGIRLLVPGGEARAGEGSLVGDLTVSTLERLHFDVFLLAVGGVHPGSGLTDFDLGDIAVKRTAIAHSDRVVVVTDSTKVGAIAFGRIAALTAAQVLVTDNDADPKLVDAFTEAGVEVELA